jgi:hypothetical protein
MRQPKADKESNLYRWRKENVDTDGFGLSKPICDWCNHKQTRTTIPGKSIVCEFCNTVFIVNL